MINKFDEWNKLNENQDIYNLMIPTEKIIKDDFFKTAKKALKSLQKLKGKTPSQLYDMEGNAITSPIANIKTLKFYGDYDGYTMAVEFEHEDGTVSKTTEYPMPRIDLAGS